MAMPSRIIALSATPRRVRVTVRTALLAAGAAILLAPLSGCGHDNGSGPEPVPTATGDFVHLVAGKSADVAYDVAITPAGERLVTGGFTDRAEFRSAGEGLTPDTDTLVSNGSTDAFIVAYRPNGTPAWKRSVGGPGSESGLGIAADAAGGVYVAMGFEQTVQLGTTSWTSAGALDVMVAKLGADHEPEWSIAAGGAGIDQPWRVALDPAGDVIVTGSFHSVARFGGTTLVSRGSSDAFVLRLTGAGALMWARGIGGASSDDAFGVDTDADRTIYVAGTYTDSTDFGGVTLHAAGVAGDAFVAAYGTNGALQWVRSANGPAQVRGFGLAIAGDRVYVAGDFKQSVTFGPSQVTSAGGYDAFVACYALNGDFQWVRRFGGPGDDEPFGVAAAGVSGVVVAGAFEQSVDFGGTGLTSRGYTDAFLLHIDAAGTVTLAEGYGGFYDETGIGVAAAGDDIVIVGSGAGTMTFDNLVVTAAGLVDGFIFQR